MLIFVLLFFFFFTSSQNSTNNTFRYMPTPSVMKLYYGNKLLEDKFIEFSKNPSLLYEIIYFSTRECINIRNEEYEDEDLHEEGLMEALTKRICAMDCMYRHSKRSLCRPNEKYFPNVCVVCGMYQKRRTKRHFMRTCSHCPSMWHVSCHHDNNDDDDECKVSGCCPVCSLDIEFRNAILSNVPLGDLDTILQTNLPSPCFRSWNPEAKLWDDTTLSLLLTRQYPYQEEEDLDDNDHNNLNALIASQRDAMTIARRFVQLFPISSLGILPFRECFSDVAKKVSKFHKALQYQLLSWSGQCSLSSPSTIVRSSIASTSKYVLGGSLVCSSSL